MAGKVIFSSGVYTIEKHRCTAWKRPYVVFFQDVYQESFDTESEANDFVERDRERRLRDALRVLRQARTGRKT